MDKAKREFPPFMVGPLIRYEVNIEGRVIPKLTAIPDGENRISLVVDGRFSASVPEEYATSVAWLLAQALAVGAGYASLNSETKERPFAPKYKGDEQ